MTLQRFAYDACFESVDPHPKGEFVRREDVINLVQNHKDWANLNLISCQHSTHNEAPNSIKFWKAKVCAYDGILQDLKKE